MFLTTLARQRFPTAWSPSLIVAGAADVDADGGVELQGPSAGGGFGVAEHHADLLADLVDEDDGGAGAVDGAGELAQRLGHQAGLEPDVAVAHLALDLGAGDQGGDGVDDDDVDGVGADEQLADFEGLLAGVGLGDEQVVEVDAQSSGPGGVEGVLGVDEGGDAVGFLRRGDAVEREGGFAGGLGAEDLDDASAWDAASAEGEVEGDRAGGDAGGEVGRVVVEPHDRALAEVPLDLGDGLVEGAALGLVLLGLVLFGGGLGHGVAFLGGAGLGGAGVAEPFEAWRRRTCRTCLRWRS